MLLSDQKSAVITRYLVFEVEFTHFIPIAKRQHIPTQISYDLNVHYKFIVLTILTLGLADWYSVEGLLVREWCFGTFYLVIISSQCRVKFRALVLRTSQGGLEYFQVRKASVMGIHA